MLPEGCTGENYGNDVFRLHNSPNLNHISFNKYIISWKNVIILLYFPINLNLLLIIITMSFYYLLTLIMKFKKMLSTVLCFAFTDHFYTFADWLVCNTVHHSQVHYFLEFLLHQSRDFFRGLVKSNCKTFRLYMI